MAAWLPNIPETIVTMLATAAVGATFSSTSPDFGTAGVLDRFGQIEPTVLVAADGYVYGGKVNDCLRPAGRDPRRAAQPPADDRGARTSAPRARRRTDAWPDVLAAHAGAELTLERFPFDHPWYVLYSSGTTGKPKAIVHRAGGVLLKHLVEHQLHCDVRPGDRVFYFTTAGWMMWNWLASGLASGATLVLYDGSPVAPAVGALRPGRRAGRHAVRRRRPSSSTRSPQPGCGPADDPRPDLGAHDQLHRLAAGRPRAST